MSRVAFVTVILLSSVLFCCRQDKGDPALKPGRTDSLDQFVREPVLWEDTGDSSRVAVFRFDQTIHHFDTIAEGEIVSHVFSFTNEGTVPLEIRRATSTCGCTVPEYPEGPVQPGERGEITVRFHSLDKTGSQDKPISLLANTRPRKTVLRLRGYVKNKKER